VGQTVLENFTADTPPEEIELRHGSFHGSTVGILDDHARSASKGVKPDFIISLQHGFVLRMNAESSNLSVTIVQWINDVESLRIIGDAPIDDSETDDTVHDDVREGSKPRGVFIKFLEGGKEDFVL